MSSKIDLIDSHFHIWDLDEQNLPWLEDFPSIFKTYTIEDYKNEYKNHEDRINFLGGVYVEVDSDDPIKEDKLIYPIYKDNKEIVALIPRVQVSEVMRVPVFASGIREPLHIPAAEEGKCKKDFFIEGINNLTKAGFTFDSCNRVDELGDLVEMMEQIPDAKVVLNHLGNVEELTSEYKKNMKALSKFDNLYVKVSGFATKDKEFVKEILDFVKSTFRRDRLMYASNWPVVELYSTFDEHIEALLEAFDGDEDFFKNNAIECYSIEI